MQCKTIVLITISSLFFLTACNQAQENVNKEVKNHVNQANQLVNQSEQKVQQVIKDLGLVYVEDGAQDVVTYDEVNAAQQAWCDALVKIGMLKQEGGDYKAYAEKVISETYNYDNGKVFFKPTLAFGKQTFRNDKKGALAYFVGGDADYPDDNGFALKPWVKARYDNAGEKMKAFKFMALLQSLWVMFGLQIKTVTKLW